MITCGIMHRHAVLAKSSSILISFINTTNPALTDHTVYKTNRRHVAPVINDHI